jgi:hypothetical protein
MKREHLAIALACGCEAAMVFYAAIRIGQVIFVPEPNPAIAMAGLHSGYFWRLWIAGYGGGFVALLVALLPRSTDRLVHIATRALPFVGALIVGVGVLLP